jgi:hypothetical protein
MNLLRVLTVVVITRRSCLECTLSLLQVSKERGISVQELMVSGVVTSDWHALYWRCLLTRIAGVVRS